MRLSSSVDTVSSTTATMRAVGPNTASASRWHRLSVPYVEGCTEHVARRPDTPLERAIVVDQLRLPAQGSLG